jgi:hypothetical protein
MAAIGIYEIISYVFRPTRRYTLPMRNTVARALAGPESHLWVSVQIKEGEIASKSRHILTKNVRF